MVRWDNMWFFTCGYTMDVITRGSDDGTSYQRLGWHSGNNPWRPPRSGAPLKGLSWAMFENIRKMIRKGTAALILTYWYILIHIDTYCGFVGLPGVGWFEFSNWAVNRSLFGGLSLKCRNMSTPFNAFYFLRIFKNSCRNQYWSHY